MHASNKKREEIKIFWKNWNLLFEFLTQFFENLTKKCLSSKKSNFRKKWFLMPKLCFSGKNYYWPMFFLLKIKKTHFWKFEKFVNLRFFQFEVKPGLSEGLAPEDSPHVKQKDMMLLLS